MALAMAMHLMTGFLLVAAQPEDRPILKLNPEVKTTIRIINADTDPMVQIESAGLVLEARRLRLRGDKQECNLDATKDGVCMSTKTGSYTFRERTEGGSK